MSASDSELFFTMTEKTQVPDFTGTADDWPSTQHPAE